MISVLIVLLNMAFAAAPTDGIYVRGCYLAGEDDVLQSTMTIQQNKWIQTHTAFEDESCQVPYLIFETQYSAQIADSNVALTVDEVSYTTLSKEVSEALNMMSYCGFSNWKAHEKKIVTGLLCDEFQAPRLAEVLNTSFRIQTNVDQGIALFLGAETSPYIKRQP